MKRVLILAALMATPPAHAGSFKAPEGCETFMTVQARGCRVSNHYRCTTDQPGDQWRADAPGPKVYVSAGNKKGPCGPG